jgi:hypothetical protein
LAGQTDYQIHTLARNGIFNENLHIRRTGDVPIQTKNGVEPPWEQSWEITRNFKIIKRSKWHKFVAMNTKATPQ